MSKQTTNPHKGHQSANRLTRLNRSSQSRWKKHRTKYEYDDDGNTVTTIDAGQPNGDGTAIVDGTRKVTVTGLVNQTLSVTTIDIASGITTDSLVYSNFDSLQRAQRVTYLDGSHRDVTYSCCAIDSDTDRYGITTTYGYDDLKRLIASTRNNISKIIVYDPAGNVVSTIRQGTNGTQIVQNISTFDLALRLTSSTDAMTNTTTITEVIDNSNQLVRTTTNPDASTRIETYFEDESLKGVTGTAVHGVRYTYGVESESGIPRYYLKTINLNLDGSDSSEWTKTYTDLAGRNYKTVYPDGAYTKSFYNSIGQLWKQVDADGVVTLYQYNAKSDREYTAIDMDRNDTIDFAGTDKITRTLRDVVTDYGVGVQRTRTYAWTTESADASILTSTYEASVDGLRTWQSAFGVTNQSVRVCDGAGNCYITNLTANGAYNVSYLQNGYAILSTRFDSTRSQVNSTTYTYDAHGRCVSVTDARNDATTNTFDNADRITTFTTPVPGTGLNAQMTTSYYDVMGHVWKVVQPDTSSVTNIYFVTGELQITYGSRTYPVEYTYDYAGRMQTMKTWQSFAGNSGTATTTWNYDSQRGFVTSKRYADNNGPNYTYTSGGKLSTRVWSRGITTTYSYDNGGNLTGIAYSDGTTAGVTNTYDRRFRKIGITDGVGSRSLTYSDAGQLLSDGYTSGFLSGFITTNGYDGYSRRTNLAVLNSTPVASAIYGYDAASRLQTVSDGTNSGTYSYIANSPLVGQIVFKQSGTTRMTTTKAYDFLNRLTAIGSVDASSTTLDSHAYTYNDANQRTEVYNADGTYWLYEYDSLGQVISGHKYWPDSSTVSGQQFDYAFDDIGNRTSAARNSRSGNYTANALNQYTSRTVPGYVDVIGNAVTNATVTVNYQRAERKGQYFRKELQFNNNYAPVFAGITNFAVLNNGTNADIVATNTGNVFLPATPESYKYDSDGNLLSDGHWNYSWDGENRLISVATKPGTPVAAMKQLIIAYDSQGRRFSKTVYNWSGASYAAQSTNRFIYDGWNLVVELDGNNTPVRSYLSGLDLSGSLQGAGGVGGLLAVNTGVTGVDFASFDGNGNVTALVNTTSGVLSANYEYGPFGEVIRASGPMAKANSFRFSTKYQDDENDLLYYGHRYLNALTGRWLSRDPINESGFIVATARKLKFNEDEEKNLYGFLDNDPLSDYDINGLSASTVLTCAGGLVLAPVEIPAGAIIVGTAVVAGVTYCIWKLCKCGSKPPGCWPCTPAAGSLLYEIAPGNSRIRGKHVGIDHVKYWRMNQVPYTDPANNFTCSCFWNIDHVDENTLIPTGGQPGGPPSIVSGPTLGGGIAP